MTGSILIVDDDEDIVEVVRLVLEGEGYRVDAAANGRVAIDLLATADPLPAVILLDLMMPVMNGFEFRKAQLADPRIAAVPVVLMSADGSVMDRVTPLQAAGAIAKPFDIDELLAAVAGVATA